MVLMLRLVVMMVVVVTPMAVVVKMGVRMSPMMVVVFQVGSMVVSVIMRRVSPIKLVFSSNLLETLPGLFRR